MGKAFIKGLSHSTNNKLHVVEPITKIKLELKNEFNLIVSSSNAPEKQMEELVPLCNYVLICIKPQTFISIKEILRETLSDNQIVISIMAGISSEVLCNELGIQNAIRVMPNTPGQIGKGFSVWFKKNDLADKSKNEIESILGTLGEYEEVSSEEIIDKATAVSGSGPGYIFYFMESMLKSCQEIGLNEKISRKLIIETFLGSAELAKASNKDFNSLKKEVTSPNGTTEAGLNSMIKNNFNHTIIDGIKAAYTRAKELNND